MWLDLLYGVRGLRRSPMFAAVAISSMAIGIGANTAVFSVFNARLLRPLPYAQADALVSVFETDKARATDLSSISPPDFLAWRSRATTVQGLAAYRDWTPNLTGVAQAERLTGLRVSGGFFTTLGVMPALGRMLTLEDERDGAAVVVISEALWRRAFAGDPRIAGRAIRLDGATVTVAGVAPVTLQFPADGIDVWGPLDLAKEQNDRGEHSLLALGRLAPGAAADRAVAELRALSASHEAESNGHIPSVMPLREWLTGSTTESVLWGLLGAVGLLLLLACANVANLLFARGTQRLRELTIRTAIGASHRRLLGQLVTESLLLSGIAGVAGLMLALWSVEALAAILPESGPFVMNTDTTIDWRVLSYTAGLSIVAGLVFGGLPALRFSRIAFTPTYAAARTSSTRIQRTLLVAQTALAVTLLAGAGLLTRGFLSLWSIDPGFKAHNVLTARVSLPSNRPPDQQALFFARAIERLDGPDIEAAAAVTHVPMSGIGNSGYLTLEGREALSEDPATRPGAARFIVTAGYFRALGISAVKGRLFTESDGPGAPPVVVVNEALARRYWPGEPGEAVIGRRIKRGTPVAPFPWLTIVGVVPDVKQQGLGASPGPMIYLPLPQSPSPSMTLVVRSPLPDAVVAARVRAAIRAIDPDQPVSDVRPLDAIVFGSVSLRWTPMVWMIVCAGCSLLLASLGVYGVVNFIVEQRRREFGIRLALGATRGDLMRFAVRQGLGPSLLGAMIGVGAAMLLDATVKAKLFAGGASTASIPTLIAAAALFCVMALVASYGPSRRIVNEDAVLALKSE